MRTRTRAHAWRGLVVALSAAGLVGAMGLGSPAAAADQTVTQSVELTVPGEDIAELCASGAVSQCVTVATGPSTLSGTLTVQISTPGVTPTVDVQPCATAGVVVTVTGAVSGGSVSATLSGTVEATGVPPQSVNETVTATTPNEQDTLIASLCLQRG